MATHSQAAPGSPEVPPERCPSHAICNDCCGRDEHEGEEAFNSPTLNMFAEEVQKSHWTEQESIPATWVGRPIGELLGLAFNSHVWGLFVKQRKIWA